MIEYHTISFPSTNTEPHEIDAALNKLGKEEWELSSVALFRTYEGEKLYYTLKRSIDEDDY